MSLLGLGGSDFGERLLNREIIGWDLILRCCTEEALAASNRAVLEALPSVLVERV